MTRVPTMLSACNHTLLYTHSRSLFSYLGRDLTVKAAEDKLAQTMREREEELMKRVMSRCIDVT